MMSERILLLAFFCAPATADFGVTLFITREVRGAIYPMFDTTSTQCIDPCPWTVCSCSGGAPRRKAALAAYPDAIAIGDPSAMAQTPVGASRAGAGKNLNSHRAHD